LDLEKRWKRKIARKLLRESESYFKESRPVFNRQKGREKYHRSKEQWVHMLGPNVEVSR